MTTVKEKKQGLFTKETAGLFREDFKKAVQALEEQYNCDLKLGTINFSPTSMTSKIEVIKSVEGKAPEQVKFEENAPYFGLKPEDFKKTFTSGRKTYTLVGIEPKRNKYPLTAVDTEGRSFKFGTDIIDKLK